jgi:predicted phosphodiesterase
MQKLTTNRDAVLRVMQRTEAALEKRAATPGAHAAADLDLARRLRQARDWALEDEAREMALTAELDELESGADYISHHPLIALTQSAMEQFADAAPKALSAKAAEAVPEELVINTLRVKQRGRPPFRTHKDLDDLRFELEPNATVVVVGDFGTAKPPAIAVARAIRNVDPDHVIHLGDIYPSGTPELAQRHFIDVWKQHGPAGAKFWALNGNHEMDAEGTGYFGEVLTFCKQPASYFSLQNEHWKLIGLDTAYSVPDHDLQQEQKPWLHARLAEGTSRNILLTHHQMFSAVDGRPHKHRERLPRTMEEFVATGRIFGWLWGHEHQFLSYERDPKFGGYLARAVGHGGKRIKYVSGVHRFPGNAPRVLHYWEVRRKSPKNECLNGFATLRFEGPRLLISYTDETGVDWNTEIWPDQPHGT